MILNKWQLEALVKDKPGLSLDEFATELSVDKRTALRHARRHNAIVVELGHRGKSNKTRLWCKYDLPDHLVKGPTHRPTIAVSPEPRYVSLDDL